METANCILACKKKEPEINLPIKACFVGCSSEDKKSFSNASCLLAISICGATVHEGHKFLATIKLVNKYFKTCDILIADTPNRYTLKLDHPDCDIEELWGKSRQDGDDWLQRNKPFYEQLTIPYRIDRIIRWDKCIQYGLFQEKLAIINKLYDTDPNYKEIFRSNIEQYLTRYKSREKDLKLDYKLAYSYCLQYLQEECAVACELTDKNQYNYEVYPSQRCPALAATYERLIYPSHPNLLKPIKIKFKTKSKKTTVMENEKCQLQV